MGRGCPQSSITSFCSTRTLSATSSLQVIRYLLNFIIKISFHLMSLAYGTGKRQESATPPERNSRKLDTWHSSNLPGPSSGRQIITRPSYISPSNGTLKHHREILLNGSELSTSSSMGIPIRSSFTSSKTIKIFLRGIRKTPFSSTSVTVAALYLHMIRRL